MFLTIRILADGALNFGWKPVEVGHITKKPAAMAAGFMQLELGST
jgi:hypothetical protein